MCGMCLCVSVWVCLCVGGCALHNCTREPCNDGMCCKNLDFETCLLLFVYYDSHCFLFTDESVDVERQSHTIIALVEELVGESVQQYF